MEKAIFTPRLKLTLVEKAERGSQELEWIHQIRSDEKATWWSLHGQAKTLEDTERVLKGILPNPEDKTMYRVLYAVHEILPSQDTRFIGLITIRSLGGPNDAALPDHLFPASTISTPASPSSVLTLELGYQFLPSAWSRGFATESLAAVFSECRKAKPFWEPFKQVYMRAIVNAENPASLRVLSKGGMEELGVWEWTGEAVWLAGKWRERGDLHIWGMWLIE